MLTATNAQHAAIGLLMAQRLELANSYRNEYGTFSVGLYVMQGSSSDSFDGVDHPASLPVRDVITAVPILEWSVDSAETNIAAAVATMQARALGAVEVGHSPLPLAPEATAGISFAIEDGAVTLESAGRPLGVMGQLRLPVADRLAWFMQAGQTIGVLIRIPGFTWVASISSDRLPPLALAFAGNIASKNYRAFVEHSTAWVPVRVANHSVYAGSSASQDAADHHFRTYEATPESIDLPRNLEYVGPCAACGVDAHSREHCIPDWIATDHKVIPVTAPIFCVQCNNHFGDVVEKPMARIVRQGELHDNLQSPLFALWSVKTALALALAADIRVDDAWMKEVREGEIPDRFSVFATTAPRMAPGYAFSVAQFSRTKAWDGTFLLSFAMDGLLLVVIRSSLGIASVPELPQVYPAGIHARDLLPADMTLSELQAAILERITGHEFGLIPSSPKEVKSRRRVVR